MKHKIRWTKMSGAGNCFWITHFLPHGPPATLKIDWSKKAWQMCRKKTSPADGMALLSPSKSCDLKWLFYNADGSPAEMCGNLACCVTEYVWTKKLISKDFKPLSFSLETLAGPIRGERVDNKFSRIFLKLSQQIQGPFEMEFKKDKLNYMFINMGVPHAVIKLNAWPLDEKAWEGEKALARWLRAKTLHHKNGMNVSFYTLSSSKQHGVPLLKARTFERGVEDWTPACGTGALAVAESYQQEFGHIKKVLLQMPGGQLEVEFHLDRHISLISPVQWLEEKEEIL